MAAGLGFKTFTTGEVLTAGDVNGYLMQGINVFANATARDAAITSPQEGQFAFTKDNNSLWYYDGAAWVASGATGDIEGVTVTSPITGGGTSGTVNIGISSSAVVPSQTGQSGKYLTTDGTTSSWGAVTGGGFTLIATGTGTGSASEISFTSIPSTYKHLMLVFEEMRTATGDQTVRIRYNGNTSNYDFRFSGTDTTNDYNASSIFNSKTIANSASASSYSNGVYWIYDYAGSQNGKIGTGLFAYGDIDAGVPAGYRTGTSRWRNTSAINMVVVSNASGNNYGTSTVIKLYGVS